MDPINDYYGMEIWKQMLGLSGNPYQPPPMQYYGGPQQQQKKQGGSNMNTQMLQSLMGGTTATGMTPNAVNAYGEPFYGWGAKTGDWGATGSGLISGNEISAPVATEGGALAGAAPYAALAAALGAFKLNSDKMAEGKGNQGWFKTIWDEGFNEMFGNKGWWGVIKGLF